MRNVISYNVDIDERTCSMNKLNLLSNGGIISLIALNLFLLASISLFAKGAPEHWKPVSSLSQEAYNGRTKQLAELLKEGDDVNQRDPDGKTPLMWAVIGAEYPAATLLVQSGAEVNFRDNNDHTALMLVSLDNQYFGDVILPAKKRRFICLKELFRKQAHIDMAKLLIGAGADIEARDSYPGATALMHAAFSSDAKYVRFLLDRGATLSDRNDQADVMVWIEDIDILRILVTTGVDIDIQWGGSGWNALLRACDRGDGKMVKELIKYGANVNVVIGGPSSMYRGYTPLRFAEEGKNRKIVEMLKAAGATR